MGIKMVDTAEPMNENGYPVARAKHIWFDDSESLQKKLDNGSLGGGGASYTQLSQAEYDALSDDEKMNGKEYRTYDTGHIYRLGVEFGKDADISRSEVLRTYTTISDLNTRKGTSVTLVAGEDNTIAIIEALDAKEQFIEWFNNSGASTDRFGIDNTKYGKRINELKIVKMTSTDASAIAVMDSGVVLSRVYTNSTLGEWCVKKENATGLVSNAQNFKIDLTKNNPSWYGFFTFSFMYGVTPCEITVSITTDVYYTITKGQNLVSAITYTQSGANYIIGIDLTAKMYGTQVVEMPSEFGTINSLTAEQFTGDTSATFKGYDAKPITELTDLGLDGSATIQNVMDKMSIGQHCIINTTRFDDKTQVGNIEYGKVEIRRLSSGMWSLWLEDVLHGNVVAHGTCSAGKFAGWHYFATKSTYNSIAELNRAKGTSITLVNGEDNTQKIVDALSVGEQFVSFYHNNANQNRFGIDASYGNLIHELRITKCLDADLTANYATVTAFMNTGCVMSRIYYKTYSTDWTSTKDYVESLT